MNRSALSEIGISRKNRDISAGYRFFAEVEVASENRNVSTNFVTRINGNVAKQNSDISAYITVDSHRAESACDVTHVLTFRDRNVAAKAGAVVVTM